MCEVINNTSNVYVLFCLLVSVLVQKTMTNRPRVRFTAAAALRQILNARRDNENSSINQDELGYSFSINIQSFKPLNISLYESHVLNK